MRPVAVPDCLFFHDYRLGKFLLYISLHFLATNRLHPLCYYLDMDENKNPNRSEVPPENNNLGAVLQAPFVAPVTQPTVGSSLIQPEPRKFNGKKAVLWILAILLIAPVAFVLIMIMLVFAQSSLKMNNLNNHAKSLEKELSSLVFVEGQSINAKGVVDGDALTASDNPAQSTFAHGSLNVHKTLASLESEVSTNLGKSGFMREGSPEAPYYATSNNGGTYDSIIFRYIKGEEAIRVMYKFDKSYTCPKEYVCRHTPKSEPTDNIYPVSRYGALTITKMYINLSSMSSDYHSGYLY